MSDTLARYHRDVAGELVARYTAHPQPPEGWRETAVWHLEQSGELGEAARLSLEIVEARIAQLDFAAARSWVERALTAIGHLPMSIQLVFELRACTLALAVLEFGGQYREGLSYAQRMLRAATDQGSHEAAARAHLAIGKMQREMGQLTIAETSLQTARELAERDELGELEAEVRLHLAKVHQLQGRHLEALQELQIARESGEQNDDRPRLARVFTAIGDIHRVLSAFDQSQIFYMRALSLEQGSGNLIGQAILKDKLALIALDQGRLGEALASAEESLTLRERLRDVVGQARSYTVLGTILGKTQRYDRALAYLQRARDLQEQIQNPRGQGIALLHLGDVAKTMGRSDTAHASYASAQELARRNGDPVGLARALERLGDLHFEEGRRDQANISWSEALRIRERLHHVDEVAMLRSRIQGGPPKRG